MTKNINLHWKFFEQDMKADNLSLEDIEIMDAIEVLKYTELESEEAHDVREDLVFREALAKHIYNKLKEGALKGTVEYTASYQLA